MLDDLESYGQDDEEKKKDTVDLRLQVCQSVILCNFYYFMNFGRKNCCFFFIIIGIIVFIKHRIILFVK